jgi:F0F1-type ATP synthase assembly protein I
MAEPSSPEPEKQKQPQSPLAQVARYSQVAFVLPAATVVGLLAGAALDHWLGTTWLYIAGLLLGIVAGFVELTRMVLRGWEK